MKNTSISSIEMTTEKQNRGSVQVHGEMGVVVVVVVVVVGGYSLAV